jgi:hypothetical protein
MACWICNQAIALGGFSFTFGGDDDGMSMQEMLAEMTGVDTDDKDDDYQDNSLVDVTHTPNVLGLGPMMGTL